MHKDFPFTQKTRTKTFSIMKYLVKRDVFMLTDFMKNTLLLDYVLRQSINRDMKNGLR